MKYHELTAKANKDRKRVGRGISAGGGKTAGRGTKGQKSRTGKKLHAVFMGGQRALMQATPKNKGFKSLRAPAQVVYVNELSAFKGKTADNNTLFEAGLINTPFHTVKVINRGELTDKVTVKVQACSVGALAQIEKAGGSFESIAVPIKLSTDSKKVDIRKRKTAKAEAKAADKAK